MQPPPEASGLAADMGGASDRWKRVNEYAQNCRQTVKMKPCGQFDSAGNVAHSTPPGFDLNYCSNVLNNKAYVSVLVAIIVTIVLAVVQPPFVCTRKNSPINQNHYVENLSKTRLATWAMVSFLLTYFGDCLLRTTQLV